MQKKVMEKIENGNKNELEKYRFYNVGLIMPRKNWQRTSPPLKNSTFQLFRSWTIHGILHITEGWLWEKSFCYILNLFHITRIQSKRSLEKQLWTLSKLYNSTPFLMILMLSRRCNSLSNNQKIGMKKQAQKD